MSRKPGETVKKLNHMPVGGKECRPRMGREIRQESKSAHAEVGTRSQPKRLQQDPWKHITTSEHAQGIEAMFCIAKRGRLSSERRNGQVGRRVGQKFWGEKLPNCE